MRGGRGVFRIGLEALDGVGQAADRPHDQERQGGEHQDSSGQRNPERYPQHVEQTRFQILLQRFAAHDDFDHVAGAQTRLGLQVDQPVAIAHQGLPRRPQVGEIVLVSLTQVEDFIRHDDVGVIKTDGFAVDAHRQIQDAGRVAQLRRRAGRYTQAFRGVDGLRDQFRLAH